MSVIVEFKRPDSKPARNEPEAFYAEFAVTSYFSFLRGASSPTELVKQACILGMHGIGIADRNSVAGVVQMHVAAKELKQSAELKAHLKDFKLAVGARLVFDDGTTPDILAYPRDRAAWARLTRLLSLGKLRAEKGDCLLGLPDLIEFIEGLNLIVIPPVRLNAKALGSLLRRLQSAASANAVWLGASMPYRGDDARRLAKLNELSRDHFIPLIAINDVLYHVPERRGLQDVVTCIREHSTIDQAGKLLEANAERHLKPPAEMARLFRKHPQAIQQTRNFLSSCAFSLEELRGTEYPEETRRNFATPQEALVAYAEAGAKQRFPDGMKEKERKALNEELRLTSKLGYAPFFLTVHDIVRFAREKGILCQGRGSAANSLICYCLGITEVDPGVVDLLFERFVSEERNEPPDIDVDFEHERREEVIQYIYETYTRERAGLAATVIRYRGRSAIRDVGKVFGLSNDVVTRLSATMWAWQNEGVNDTNAQRAGFDTTDERLISVMLYTRALVDFPRHLSQHVGGFVMTRSRLDEVVPIENAAMEKRTVIEWEKNDLEALGLLKVDILALGMLTCLKKGFDLLQAAYGVTRQLSEQDEDPRTYAMIQRADTLGTFQIESRAQMSMLPRLRPKQFYDLVIEVAIVRPGPIQGNMVHPYLRRRQELEKVTYPSPELEAILKRTLGVPLFQEQAMRIAIVAAGFKPGKADRLRRAMATFKRVGTISTFEQEFIGGMVARGYDEAFARNCWKQIEGFGSYGFPESHAASFANLVYASCWVKCHYPDVFAAALLNSQPMGFYAPAQIVRDAQEHGVEVREVDINTSNWDCTLERAELGSIHRRHEEMECDILTTHALRLGFRQVVGLSEKDAKLIEDARGKGFDSVRDLWLRTGLKPSMLERLAEADAFGSLGLPRREALWAVKALRRSGDKDDAPLFQRTGMAELEPDAELPPMPPGQEVIEDYRHLHLSLKSHPVGFLRDDLNALGVTPHHQLPMIPSGRRVSVAGIVLVRQRPGEGKAIFISLEDETGIANIILWMRVFEEFRPIVLGARLISVTGIVQNENGVVHIVCDRMDDLTHLLRRLSEQAGSIDVRTPADHVKRPINSRRHPRQGDTLVTLFNDDPAMAQNLALDIESVMPKGRNFH